ncbi:MAG: galactokinase [Opitutae bacterium]|nr:galactokinase [Opitutae bacterium]
MKFNSPQQAFESVYGRPPVAVIQSPGRINLIGEHVDYLDGLVMPVAIDRHVHMAVSPGNGHTCRVWSALSGGEPVEISMDKLEPRPDSWLNYIIGVLALLRDSGTRLPTFDAVITSDLPTGAGLSSSAALETATALCMEALTGEEMTPVKRARLCQQAEHDFAGVPCGIMDQLAVGAGKAGHALQIDCRDLYMQLVPIPDDMAILVTDTRVKHSLGDGEYRKRREDCEKASDILGVDSLRDADLALVESGRDRLGDQLFRRARHAVSEIERVRQFNKALESSDTATIGKLMLASHQSLRNDFNVSCDELDILVEAAYDFGPERGLFGSRMTGGGFGGSTISLVRRDAAEELKQHLQSAFRKHFKHEVNPFITQAVDGAKIIEA